MRLLFAIAFTGLSSVVLSQKAFIRIESPDTLSVILDTIDQGNILPGEGAFVIKGLSPGVYHAIFRYDNRELHDSIVIHDHHERILYVDIKTGTIEDRSPVDRPSKQAVLTYSHPSVQYDTMRDMRDKQIYKTVRIGEQIWLAENLKFKSPTGSSVYPRDHIHEIVYGRLYTWEAAVSACPEGWHLPSDDEWKEIEHTLGMTDFLQNGRGWRSPAKGSSLKSAVGWISCPVSKDETGFSVLPGGYCDDKGYFFNEGYFSYFWTSTGTDESNAWYRVFTYDIHDIGKFSFSKKYRFSVRCVRDLTAVKTTSVSGQ